MALEYLGAGLKLNGHEVEILDARLQPDIEAACQRFQPQLVGMTGYTSHLNIIKGIAARLKALFPALTVVVGGHHATVRTEDFNDPTIDVVVIGEGVFTLREIVQVLEAGGSFLDILGLAIPSVGGMRFSPPRRYTDLNTLPFPDRSLTEFYAEYAKLWTKAVSFYRIIPTLARFGAQGMLQRIRLFGKFLQKVRSAHMDY